MLLVLPDNVGIKGEQLGVDPLLPIIKKGTSGATITIPARAFYVWYCGHSRWILTILKRLHT
jgi:hypothetical protein